ncbi:MAG: serine hydrolase domain-containing protein, partial [Acetobacteraceae bacterium]
MKLPLVLPRRSALAAAAIAAVAPRASARTPPPSGDADPSAALDKVVADSLRRTGVPGIAVGVVHKDTVVYLRGFGVRAAGEPAAVGPDTVFQLASLSKPIASTVVAALVGDKRIAWDDPIVLHDPAFAMHEPWVTSQVTLRDMFCHRSGLPDHAGDKLEDLGFDRAEVLHRLRYQRPASSFRSEYAYTNFGLTAAAVAAAMASGKSWEDLSAERLYSRLGMANTSSRFADFANAADHARGHVRQDGVWVAKYVRDPDAQSPAGGVSSSARDMTKWLRLQLGRGSVDGDQIVAADALDETHRPQIVNNPPANPMIDRAGFYGLGWNVSYDAQGSARWGHSGGFNLGAGTCVNVLPGEQLAVVALTNGSPVGLAEAVCRSALDIMLTGAAEKDWLALFGPFMEKAMAPDYGIKIDYARPPAAPSPPLP